MTTKWQCPQCNREFAKINQSHSCKVYPLENHFKGKPYAKELFEELISKIESEIGPVKIESLSCCIHLVSSYTFTGVWAKKDKLTLDFRVPGKIESDRFTKIGQLSVNRRLYYLDLFEKKDIDQELLTWLKQSYELN